MNVQSEGFWGLYLVVDRCVESQSLVYDVDDLEDVARMAEVEGNGSDDEDFLFSEAEAEEDDFDADDSDDSD